MLFRYPTVVALCAIPRMGSYDAYLFGPAILIAFWPNTRRLSVEHALPAFILVCGLFKEGLVLLPILLLIAVVRKKSRWERQPIDARTN